MIPSRLTPNAPAITTVDYRTLRNRPLLILGSWLFALITFSLLLPLTIRNTQQFTLTYVALSVAFTFLALVTSRSFPKQAFPVLILLAMQAWGTITFLIVQPGTITEQSLGRHLYWPVLLCLPFFVLSSICHLDPNFRQKALRILYWVCLINAIVGIMQFLRVPGFQTLQNFYAPKTLAQDYFGATPHAFRSVGLTLHPYMLAAQCLFGLALVGSNLLERKLKPHEILSIAIFLCALFMAQSRSFYASGALLATVLLVLLFRRDKPTFVWAVSLFALGGFVLVGTFSSRLEYGVRGPSILESGRVDKWEVARKVVEEYPITGIGPNMAIFGNKSNPLPDRRGLEYTENAYRMIAATAGIPGLVLLITGLVGSLFIAIKVVWKSHKEPLQRRMAFVGIFYVISLAVGMNISNLVEQELMTFFGMCTAAIAIPPALSTFQQAAIRSRFGKKQKLESEPA